MWASHEAAMYSVIYSKPLIPYYMWASHKATRYSIIFNKPSSPYHTLKSHWDSFILIESTTQLAYKNFTVMTVLDNYMALFYEIPCACNFTVK